MFPNTLSGRFLVLTVAFVMLAEVLILVPSVARFREDYLRSRLERAQIASLTLLADDMITDDLEAELLENAEVYNVVLRRDEARELILSSPLPLPVQKTFDLRDPGAFELIRDAMFRLWDSEKRLIRVIGDPVREGGLVIEVVMDTEGLRAAMVDYGLRILALSAVISIITAILLYWAVERLMVRPIQVVVRQMMYYAEAPEDARRIIEPRAGVREIRQAEEALQGLEQQLSASLKQKERLAQLGGAVARISHDLRNILTTSQLFADRLELSQDPAVARSVPKLVNSISRAVNLCESTLAFGKAQEPAPALTHMMLVDVVDDVFESERLASEDYDISYAEDIPQGLALRADPEQLYRVLSNLVRNARQAIMATGKPGEIAIQGSETEDEWQIRVADTGPGLSAKAQERLFQPFAGTGRRGGTGLGLAIAAELVRGHGGRLELETTGESGTVFVLHLPKGLTGMD